MDHLTHHLTLDGAVEAAAVELGLPESGGRYSMSDLHLLVAWALLELSPPWTARMTGLFWLEREAQRRRLRLSWELSNGGLTAALSSGQRFLVPFSTYPFQSEVARRWRLNLHSAATFSRTYVAQTLFQRRQTA